MDILPSPTINIDTRFKKIQMKQLVVFEYFHYLIKVHFKYKKKINLFAFILDAAPKTGNWQQRLSMHTLLTNRCVTSEAHLFRTKDNL